MTSKAFESIYLVHQRYHFLDMVIVARVYLCFSQLPTGYLEHTVHGSIYLQEHSKAASGSECNGMGSRSLIALFYIVNDSFFYFIQNHNIMKFGEALGKMANVFFYPCFKEIHIFSNDCATFYL